MSDLIGKTLSSRYQILSLLGEGGMGSVYKARDLTLERDVAIKIMHRHNLGKQEFQQRFLLEARAAARLNHPGIVQVFDFGEAGDLLFIVMEFILGENLDQMIRRLRRKGQWVALDEAIELVRQIALALDYGHRQGVVHRDIKPANIMIKAEPIGALPYRPIITDLGLAKLMIGEGMATQTGLTMGTPAYMAPEQIRGGSLDARSDIYSLGILLYELAVGQLPFAVKTFTQIVHDHLHEPPPAPQTLAPSLPDALVAVLMKSLAKIPTERYATAGELAQALEELPTVALNALVPPTANAGVGSLLTEHHAILLNDAELLDLLERFGPGSPPPPQIGQIPYLRICTPDQRVQVVALTTPHVTIGRQVDNTVSLDDDKVSRYHAELKHDETGYWITDLDSTNGVYLGEERLQPHIRTQWQPEQPLRIGEHVIFLHPEGNYEEIGDAAFKSTTDEMPRSLVPLLATPMTLLLAQSEYVVAPGQSVQIPITLHNQSTKSEQFFLTVAGIPREWITSPLPTAALSPGAQQTVTLTIAPPRAPETTAQPLPLQIRVNSQQSSGLQVQTQCLLHISPYNQFQSAVFWGQGRRGRHLTVHVANQGNVPQIYQISWHDSGSTVALDPPMVTIQAPPGKEVMTFCKVQPQPQHRRLIGVSQQHTIQTRVIASNGETQMHDLPYLNRPLLPVWLAGLVVLLSIILVAGLGWYMQGSPSAMLAALPTLAPLQETPPSPTATVVAATATVVAVVVTATPLPPTPTLAPPTATLAPPTPTPVPPTPIPVPPTPTPVPPTATSLPPTVTVAPTAALTLTTTGLTVPVTISNSVTLTGPLAISGTTPLSASVTANNLSPVVTPEVVTFLPFLNQGYALTNAATDGQRDLLILSKPAQESALEWRWFDNLSASELDPLRSAGYFVVQLVYHQQRWGVGLTLTADYTDQVIISGLDFPKAEVAASSSQGLAITQLVYGGGQWVVVLSRGAGFAEQTWNIEVSFPADVIESQRAAGFALTQLAYGSGIWVVVMTKGVALQGQEFLTGEEFPEGQVRQKQLEGKYLTHLVYSDSLWVAVVSAGADVTEQIWFP